MDEERDVIFSEVQRFRQLWVWGATLLPLALVIWHVIIEQHYLDIRKLQHISLIIWHVIIEQPVLMHKPVKSEDFIILLIIGIIFPIFMYSLNLRTEVRSDGLYFRFFPFHLSFCKINLSDIEKYEARTYNPILEYGGWGLRRSGKHGKAYNVSGNRGVQIILKDGEKILFGSQRPEEFVEALAKVKANT